VGVTEPLPVSARGGRPNFFDDPAIDTLLAMLLELAKEQSVTRERLARLEHYVESRGGEVGAVEALELPADVEAGLAAQRHEFVARLFRAVERG
jgi:hypothetical protein